MDLLIFPCVLASGESTLDCEGWSEVSEPWLWWRGNLSASQTWSRRWSKEPWIRVLSTRTFFGSLGTDTEAWWISSAADFRASRSQSLVVAKPPRMKDISGLTSNQGLLFSNQKFVSLRTSMESLLPDPPDTTQFSTMSSATWNQWVTEQRQDSSQRRKLARHTCEKDGSSWPTPTARDWKDGTNPSDKAPTNGLLGRAVPRDPTSQPGQLSPDWVDMLMGFPVGWTDLEPWVTR